MGRKSGSVFHLGLKDFNLKLGLEIFRLGAPAGVIKGSNSVGGTLINNMLTALNMPYLVAAYGVFSQVTVFVRSSWYAAADTLHAFAGVFIGEEDRASLKETQKISLRDSLILTGLVTVILFVFAGPITGIFLKSNDPQALSLGRECIRVACFSLPFHAIVYNFNNYLMAVVMREHGFNDGKKHNINARLVSKDDDLIIRMRDDCKPFNMTDYYQLIQEENDVEKEIG